MSAYDWTPIPYTGGGPFDGIPSGQYLHHAWREIAAGDHAGYVLTHAPEHPDAVGGYVYVWHPYIEKRLRVHVSRGADGGFVLR